MTYSFIGNEMMTESTNSHSQNRTTGDAAVNGLFAGIAAGLVMGVYLFVAGILMGISPAGVLASFVPQESFPAGAAPSPLTGILVHLAVSGVYGAIFGVGVYALWRGRLSLLPLEILGLGYGMGLLLVAEALILPGAGSNLLDFGLLHLAVAHAIYGLSLGLVTRRTKP